MLILYQFPISHYCEKVRWALDYKQIDYQVKNLIPGLHVLTTKKLSAQTSVPILVHNHSVIQGSSHIISYLDEKYPEQRLTPEESLLKDQTLEWERYVDKEIGIHIRRYCYHILLEHPDIVIPFFTHNGSWYGKTLLPFIFPKLKIKMREQMNINTDTAQRSRELLKRAIDKIYDHLQKNKFLAGDQFTRADLSAASLLAPLCKPAKYGLIWPDRLPQPIEDLINECDEKVIWVNELYEKYR